MSSRRAASLLVDSVVKEVEIDSIKERIKKAKVFSEGLEAKEEEYEFKFVKPSCERQVKFNVKVKAIFGVDLKAELETCFGEKKLPKEVEDLMKEVEVEIDEQNVKLKVADEFGYSAAEEFSGEDLARNSDEERKIKIFRKEKKERVRGGGSGVSARFRLQWCSPERFSRGCVKRSFGRRS